MPFLEVPGMTGPGKIPTAQAGIEPRICRSQGGHLNHWANEALEAGEAVFGMDNHCARRVLNCKVWWKGPQQMCLGRDPIRSAGRHRTDKRRQRSPQTPSQGPSTVPDIAAQLVTNGQTGRFKRRGAHVKIVECSPAFPSKNFWPFSIHPPRWPCG